MRSPNNRWLVVCCTLVAGLSLAQGPRGAEREALKAAMQSVIDKSALKNARVTVQVRSLDDGTVVFARDADELLNPASNVKLFTAAAALVRLGTEYRFETEFLTDPDFKDGKAKTLFIRGKGDPTVSTERLYGMVTELVHAGLTKELQDIVVDDSWFDAERTPPGFDQEYGDKAYLAPTGALSLNWNTVGVYLRPGEALGAKAAVEIEPNSDYFVLDADVTTGTKTQRRFTVSSSVDKDRVREKIEARGVVPFEKGSWSAWKKIDQPGLYFGFTVRELLRQRGVKVKGRVRAGLVPPGQKMLHVAQSETLDIVLKKMNKHSSNFVAEQLIKTLGAEGRGAPGSHAKGIDVVEEFLEKDVGLARGTYVMKNGSGLNDTNRFSAAQTNRLLVTMIDKFPLMPEYLSSLGIAGKDGTLKYRFEGSDAVGRLRAKTGTLENVSALSGYVQAVGGEKFVFSVMVNDFPGRASTVVQYIDALGAAVAASSGTAGGPSAAVLALTAPATVVGPYEELKARVKTYVGLAQRADRRNVAFLRTAWRTEKDPAVRAIIAEALYQSDPREAGSVRILLDSAVASDDAFGRLAKASLELSYDTPLLPSLVELASSGSGDACSRIFEFVRYLGADESRSSWLSEQLAVVATDAPQELLQALKTTPEGDRPAVIDALVTGLVKAAQPQAPLWPTLRAAQGSPDPSMAQFARELEAVLSQKVAAAHAPVATPVATTPAPAPLPPAPTPVAPGG
jgi:D-alanyl-D-alanine carboxypeptidase/D-alanyl-D-alanine-endopeptidase (penicillin-binding protein 4)